MMERSSPFFFRLVDQSSNNPDFVHNIKSYVQNLDERGLPIIFDLVHFSMLTEVPVSYIVSILKRKASTYRIFYIKKRNGGKRRIAVPENNLKKLQGWIKTQILDYAHPHSTSMAYSRGSSIVQNANLHCGKRFLIKLDLSNFFESISERRVFHVFHDFGYSRFVAFMLTRICTYPLRLRKKSHSSKWSSGKGSIFLDRPRNDQGRQILGSLLQGAQTSPQLSNLCMRSLDAELSQHCIDANSNYTRYSDDISISSNFLDRQASVKLIRTITVILGKGGLKINRKKKVIAPPGARKIVTGLMVNSERPTLPKHIKSKIKNYLYYCRRYGPANAGGRSGFRTTMGFRNHIKGLIDFAKQVHPEIAAKYQNQFTSLNWPDI